jgi:hypothetical protein
MLAVEEEDVEVGALKLVLTTRMAPLKIDARFSRSWRNSCTELLRIIAASGASRLSLMPLP